MRQITFQFENPPKHSTSLPLRPGAPTPIISTGQGTLFHGDCLDILPLILDESVDTIFADPPFNLGKVYGDNVNDNLGEKDYVEWCKNGSTNAFAF